jgi:predicted dehydrogenase
MAPVRIGIIGCSPVGAGHARHLRQIPGAEIVAVADPDAQAAGALAEECGAARVYAGHAALLGAGGVDAAVVAVPTHLHAAVGTDVLRAGVHAFIEKPPARSLAELRQLRDAAAASGVRVMIGYQRRHDPHHLAARQLLAEGALGRLYYARASWISARLKPEQGPHCFRWSTRGAAMASLGSHCLDFTWWLMGEPRPLRAVAWAHRGFCAQRVAEDAGDDLMVGMVWLDGDRMIQIEAARKLARSPAVAGEIYGETGSYSERGAIVRVDAQGCAAEEPVGPPPEDGTPDWQVQGRRQMEHFVRRVRGEDVPGMDLESAAPLQAMLDALYASAETGRIVEVAALPGR